MSSSTQSAIGSTSVAVMVLSTCLPWMATPTGKLIAYPPQLVQELHFLCLSSIACWWLLRLKRMT